MLFHQNLSMGKKSKVFEYFRTVVKKYNLVVDEKIKETVWSFFYDDNIA